MNRVPRPSPPPVPRRASATRAITLLLAAASLDACYRYVPATPSAPPQAGAHVRAHLTPQGATTLATVLGQGPSVVDGRVFAVQPAGLLLDVFAVRKAGESRPTAWVGERVTLPTDAVERLEWRRLDRKRTVRAALLSAAGAAVAGLLFAQIGGGADSRGQAPPTETRP